MLQKPMPKQDKGGGINPRRGASVKVADSTAERQIFAAPPLAVFSFRSLNTRGNPALDKQEGLGNYCCRCRSGDNRTFTRILSVASSAIKGISDVTTIKFYKSTQNKSGGALETMLRRLLYVQYFCIPRFLDVKRIQVTFKCGNVSI